MADAQGLARRMLFFVEGISDPQKKAKDWAIANSWNNQLKQNEYTKFVSAPKGATNLMCHQGTKTQKY